LFDVKSLATITLLILAFGIIENPPANQGEDCVRTEAKLRPWFNRQ
jgi:hypothetical protein